MKKKALKEAVVKAMKNYTCSVFSGRNQHECVTLEKEARDYFSDANVLARVLNPQTYFQQFSTVALKEVPILLSPYVHKYQMMYFFFTKANRSRKKSAIRIFYFESFESWVIGNTFECNI